MQTIIPHLWFDREAKQAAEFYASLLPNSRITNVTTIHDTPSGDCDIVSFTVSGYEFMAISAGPLFKLNPSISLMLNFDPAQDPNAKTRIDEVWAKLSDGGTALMPLDKYPFSERYGWIQDRFGLSWQLILTDPAGEPRPTVLPFLMFVGDVCGKAEEASDFYMSLFPNSKRGALRRYGADRAPDREGTVELTDFQLAGQWFTAIDSAHAHNFAFNEAISLIVNCDTQAEIDHYWNKLSADPAAEQCGWLKDPYGVSWQITPTAMQQMMQQGTPEQIARVTQAFLPMKKFDLEKLKQAYEGQE